MNERIRELTKKAEMLTDEATNAFNDDSGNWPYIWNEVYDEKFAELIIKETMQVVANQLPSNQYLDVAHAVIEHFRVKE
jgi:hypothetical protein